MFTGSIKKIYTTKLLNTEGFAQSATNYHKVEAQIITGYFHSTQVIHYDSVPLIFLIIISLSDANAVYCQKQTKFMEKSIAIHLYSCPIFHLK